MTPEDIERLFAGAEVAATTTQAADSNDEPLVAESSEQAAALLKPVLDTVQELWQATSLRLDEAARAIADGSRKGESRDIRKSLLYGRTIAETLPQKHGESLWATRAS